MSEPGKYWVVARYGRTGAGGKTRKLHQSRHDAERAAIDIASRNPGITYVILETVGHIEIPPPKEVKSVFAAVPAQLGA
jgi:hypothetical protein